MTTIESEQQKKGLDWQKSSLHAHHAFLYISLPLLHDRDMKLPNSTRPLYRVGEHNKKICFYFFKLRDRSFFTRQGGGGGGGLVGFGEGSSRKKKRLKGGPSQRKRREGGVTRNILVHVELT